MMKGVFLTENEFDQIMEMLNNIDVEIGSTITYPNDLKKVMENMRRANYNLFKIIEMFEDI